MLVVDESTTIRNDTIRTREVMKLKGMGQMMYPKNYIKPKRKALKTKPRLKSADTRSIKNLGKPVKRR